MSVLKRWRLVLLLVALPSCLYVGGRTSIGPSLDLEAVARIVPGQTTRTQVLQWLGPPHEFRRPELTAALLDDRARLAGVLAAARRAEDVYTWQRHRVSGDGTLLLLYNGLGVETDTDLLVVFFDADGVVSDVAVSWEERS